jgi:hypothetical protein
MKKYINYVACLFITAALLTACSKSAINNNNTTTPAIADLTSALTTGNWVVSSLIEKGEDKTSKFSGMVFNFSADGSVTVKDGNKSSSGTWHYSPAVTYYGSSSKSAIDLSLGLDKPLDLLTKKWNLVSSTSTSLKIDSPELAEDEHLQFSKE